MSHNLTVAMACALALSCRGSAPSAGGPEFAVTVLTDRGGHLNPVGADGVVAPSGHLGFQVALKEKCWLQIVSVDAVGRVSNVYPVQQDSVEVRGGSVLPGLASLDGETGPERIFALCGPNRLSFADTAGRVAASMEKSESGVREIRRIPGLPETIAQSSVLIEKRR